MPTTDARAFTWTGIDPAEWLRTWQSAWRGVPQNLTQPILPGWTLNLNSNNSASPQTEVDVLAKYSYGRQLGRIADALAALVVEQHGKKPADPCYADFLQMKRDIDRVKQDGAAARVERLMKDLELLKAADKPAYERLRDELRRSLSA